MYPGCFAAGNRDCRVLKELVCEKEKSCPFFKTHQQFVDDAIKSALRLNNVGVNENGFCK